MRAGVITFCYEKADGTLRRAKGTLQGVASLVKGSGAESPKTHRYFDVKARGFRAFPTRKSNCCILMVQIGLGDTVTINGVSGVVDFVGA